MHIKEIEFTNFKSFVKKIKVPFFDDFTTISGPNGSGKSNILDGILFVLGLSSSRTLRADKLTDLIYNGGKSKSKKTNFAQVTIRFDNTDGEMPIDADEISISRKIRETDSGYYSYFYFNDKAVSLSEIHNQLSKTKITPESYNIVMQGDVTRIITMSRKERRKIIDEIAGVAEFDSKMEKAVNELDIVKEHIERVDIIIEEVKNQLDKLKIERDYALKYQSLKNEKVKYEGFVILAKLKSAKQEFTEIDFEILTKEEKIKTLSDEVASIKETLSKRELDLKNLNSKIFAMGEDEQIQIRKDIVEIKGNISQSNDSIKIIESNLNDITKEIRSNLKEIDSAKNKISELILKINNENVRKEELNSELNNEKSKYKIVKSKIAAFDSKFAEDKSNLSSCKSKMENVKAEKNELIREEDRLIDSLRRKSAEMRDIEIEIEDSKQKISATDSDTKSAKYEIESLNKKIDVLLSDIDDLTRNQSQIKEIVDELDEILKKHQRDYAVMEARIRASEDVRYAKSVDIVLSAKKNYLLPGIYGTIAELGNVEPNHSKALEIAAGGRTQAIVVETDEDAERAIGYLKQKRGGRATFLPLNKMESARNLNRDILNKTGVVGYAIDLVTYDSKFESAFWFVFRDTLVLDLIGNARKLMGRARMVTLDGELIERSGAMTGGSKDKRGLSFKSSKDDLLKIAEKITEYDSRRNTAINKLDRVEGHISEINREIHEHEKEISIKEMQLEEISGRGERLTALIDSKTQELLSVKEAQKEFRVEMDSIAIKKEEISKLIILLEQEIEEMEKKLKNAFNSELKNQMEFVENEIRRIEKRIGDTDLTLNALNLDLEYAKKEINKKQERIEFLNEKKSDNKERILNLNEYIEEKNQELRVKQEREKDLEIELIELQKSRTVLQNEYDVARKKFDMKNTRFESENYKILALKETKVSLEEQIKDLNIEIEKRGVVDCQEVPDYDRIRARIASIERAMEKLEPVNMRAIDEYDEVQERESDLSERRNTLFNEREQILVRMEQYEKLKKDSFMDAYDGLNESFKQIFHTLSDGTGELLLDDLEDPFSGGLTLIAQPKDKTLQRLEAMSGGEKSLIALSFIFAIQEYRPAPFYAFDEVDMFLDGVNAQKVAQHIKNSSKNAQFIVVSLRKPMIEAANRTIGVAMQESNITSITGIKLR